MPPRKYNYVKAFNGRNNQRRLASAAKAYQGKNAARKRASTYNQISQGIKRYGPVLGAITGMGDYRIGRKSYSDSRYLTGSHGFKKDYGKMGGVQHTRRGQPKVKMEKGTMNISHCEYLGTLISAGATGSNNFLAQSYAINPGNSGTFPWLSSTAINFQEYKFHKLVFEYRPLVSESTSTSSNTLTSMGAVAIATQYNSILGPYNNYQQMAESDFAVTIKPSEHALHAIECNARYNPLGIQYVSAQTSLTVGANNSDIRMQNLGIVTFASNNIPVASNTSVPLGEIWVHYEITLEKPQINAYLTGLQSSHYFGSNSTGAPATTTPFGASITPTVQPTPAANNLLALTFGTNTITFPLQVTAGRYLICYYCQGTAAVAASTGFSCPLPSTVINFCNQGTVASSQTGSDIIAPQGTGLAGTTQMAIVAIVNVIAPGSQLLVVTLSTTVVPTAGQFDLIVTPYNSLMN